MRTMTNRGARRGGAVAVPALIRVLDYEAPRATTIRHDLGALDHVTIGRGEEARAVHTDRSLAMSFVDPWMSQRHAKFVRDAEGWTVVDQGARNGTFVDGARIDRADLTDGALIEIGHTVWLYSLASAALSEPLPGLATFDDDFARTLVNAAKLAMTTQSLVLHGETGTGKEVLARAIHVASGRRGDFVAVNCGALPANLVESELFGFKKGAFSGATEDRAGLVRAATGGTLFLDEIGDLPASTQAALLRVLQEKQVHPIGASKPVDVDVRVLAASHRDLEEAVAAKQFREDLLARLAGFVVEIPPLRERRADLGLLIARLLGDAAIRFAPEAGFALARHAWPRNVRELEQALATATALATDGVIELDHLTPAIRKAGSPSAPVEDLAPSDLRKRDELRALLAKHSGNLAAVARDMKVARMQIHRWLERFAIAARDYRK